MKTAFSGLCKLLSPLPHAAPPRCGRTGSLLSGAFVPSKRGKKSLRAVRVCPAAFPRRVKGRKSLANTVLFARQHRLCPAQKKCSVSRVRKGHRGRCMQQIASPQRKICKFDFLKIHLLKSIYVNLIFDFCWQRSQKSRFFFAFPVKWAIAEEVTFHPFFRPFPRENEGKRTPRRLSAAHVRGRKCPPLELP